MFQILLEEFQIEDVITNPTLLNGSSSMVGKTSKLDHNNGNENDPSYHWANELRPSMRKLRQGMDSLCKTSRLICR